MKSHQPIKLAPLASGGRQRHQKKQSGFSKDHFNGRMGTADINQNNNNNNEMDGWCCAVRWYDAHADTLFGQSASAYGERVYAKMAQNKY